MTGRIININPQDMLYRSNEVSSHIIFYKLTGRELLEIDVRKFVTVCYKNFDSLDEVTGADHSQQSIYHRLKSPNSILILAVNGKSIVGYLIAQPIEHNLRKLMHIYYLYTSSLFRGKGIATYMLNIIQRHSHNMGINTLSLTYDTYDKKLTRFYLNNNFSYDEELRSLQRYDMLVKYV